MNTILLTGNLVNSGNFCECTTKTNSEQYANIGQQTDLDNLLTLCGYGFSCQAYNYTSVENWKKKTLCVWELWICEFLWFWNTFSMYILASYRIPAVLCICFSYNKSGLQVCQFSIQALWSQAAGMHAKCGLTWFHWN